MQDIIQRYLNKFYTIKTSEVGNDGIYLIADTREFPVPVYSGKLLIELVTVFSFSDEILKGIIDIWSTSIKPDVDLEFYWKTNDEIIFPTVRRVTPTLISSELTSVQPMNQPRGYTFFMDYQYSADTANRNGRVYDEEVYREFIMGIDPALD